MTLPSFLVIGAMKAGTTTLYRDLLSSPGVFMPEDKEPEALCSEEVFTDAGLRRYERLFAPASAGQLCGEASTAYTKAPDVTGVADRALRLLGPELKLVYIVRDPVKRTISHHYHLFSEGGCGPDIDAEVARLPQLTDYSRYAMQLRPWIEAFGRERVLIVVFESYVADRAAGVREVTCFLGAGGPTDEPGEGTAGGAAGGAHNRGDGKPVLRGPWRLIAHNPAYRALIRPLMTGERRERLRRLLLPKAPPRPDPPAEGTVSGLVEALRADERELRSLLGREEPIWPRFAGSPAVTF